MLQRTLSGGGKAYPTQSGDDVLVYHCNDGVNPVVITNSGSYGTSSHTSPITATTTTANFTTPASEGGYVNIDVASTIGYFPGGHLRISGAGYYTVSGINSATQLSCRDMAYSGNTTLGGLNPRSTVISSGATVEPIIENSPTTTTANFTQPADTSTDVTISVASTAGFRKGTQVYISSGGYYHIYNIASATSMVVRLISVSTNAAGGTTILSGATVTANADMTVIGNLGLCSCAGLFTRAMTLTTYESAAGIATNTTGYCAGPLLFGTKLSLSCWVRYVPNNMVGYFFGHQTTVNSWDPVNYYGGDCVLHDVYSTNEFGMDMRNNSGPNTDWIALGYMTPNDWNYIAVTLDFSVATSNVKLYINGNLTRTANSGSGSVAWKRLFWGLSGVWNIGNVRVGATSWNSTTQAIGAIAECRLTQNVLTAQQISDIWNTANVYLL
jgi:hypothetical protein